MEAGVASVVVAAAGSAGKTTGADVVGMEGLGGICESVTIPTGSA